MYCCHPSKEDKEFESLAIGIWTIVIIVGLLAILVTAKPKDINKQGCCQIRESICADGEDVDKNYCEEIKGIWIPNTTCYFRLKAKHQGKCKK